MTRKPLPRAITDASREQLRAGALKEEPSRRPDAADHSGPLNGRTAKPQAPPERRPPLPEPVAAITPPPPAPQKDKRTSPTESGSAATQRRAAAAKVVDRHKMYAAVGGLFPVPLVNMAGVAAINVRMLKELSKLYDLPFERERTRSIVMGLVGGSVPTGLGTVATSTLAMMVPGAALAGLAVSSFTAAAMTRGIGLVFVEHFESGGRLGDVSEKA
jgi:uncharacterized protein (DUF697 family)